MKRIGLTASEEMSFENVDRRRTTDGRTTDTCIYYKLTFEPSAQVSKQITKKMNMSEIRCGSIAALFFVRQSCGVVHNTVRLLYETKKFVVPDRSTVAARLM